MRTQAQLAVVLAAVAAAGQMALGHHPPMEMEQAVKVTEAALGDSIGAAAAAAQVKSATMMVTLMAVMVFHPTSQGLA
jgi:hypothetical protein